MLQELLQHLTDCNQKAFYKVIIVIPGAEFTRLAKKFEIVAA